MDDDAFEWDDAKAAENYARHSVSFETAKRVFDDAFAIERLDDREDYGEERFSILGIGRWPPAVRCVHAAQWHHS
jgi:hypothetical protein